MLWVRRRRRRNLLILLRTGSTSSLWLDQNDVKISHHELSSSSFVLSDSSADVDLDLKVSSLGDNEIDDDGALPVLS